MRACFAAIRHGKLLRLLRRRLRDAKLLQLMWRLLRAGLAGRAVSSTPARSAARGRGASRSVKRVSPCTGPIHGPVHGASGGRTQTTPTAWASELSLARYCDDFVVLCDGTKAPAQAMRQALATFLATALKLERSLEKTRITHVSKGFLLLGFQIERTRGRTGKPVPKVRIPDTALKRLLHKIEGCLAPSTCGDSVQTKIQARNRLIQGWGQYYRATSSPSLYFRRLEYRVFWKMAHWLGRKFKLSMPRVMRRFRQQNTFGTRTTRLLKPSAFTAKWHHVRSIPNPYCAPQPCVDRESALCLEAVGNGTERQPGIADLREVGYARDEGRCGHCGQPVPWSVYHMDHINLVERSGVLQTPMCWRISRAAPMAVSRAQDETGLHAVAA